MFLSQIFDTSWSSVDVLELGFWRYAREPAGDDARYSDVTVHAFGSAMNGLGDCDCDVDIDISYPNGAP